MSHRDFEHQRHEKILARGIAYIRSVEEAKGKKERFLEAEAPRREVVRFLILCATVAFFIGFLWVLYFFSLWLRPFAVENNFAFMVTAATVFLFAYTIIPICKKIYHALSLYEAVCVERRFHKHDPESARLLDKVSPSHNQNRP